MSHQVLRHCKPLGTGLGADLAAMRDVVPRRVRITAPPDNFDALTKHQLDALVHYGDSFTFDSFTTTDAYELGHLLHARLFAEPRPALISISLTNGLTLFQATTGTGVNPDNEVWVQRKRRSVLRWGTSTWMLHCKYKGDEAAFAAKNGLGGEAGLYAIHGGAVPIRVQGVEGVVAVVVVSGLKQHEDHGVIVDVVRENWEPVA